jgi:hypothetical protein
VKFLRGSVATPREIRDEPEAVTAASVRDRAERWKLLTSGSLASVVVDKCARTAGNGPTCGPCGREREGCEAKWAKLVTVGSMMHSFVLFF